ncbi:hypothetical protein SPRG_10969, partial [Saprolegnia parasitica CBS 223.65]
MWMGSLRREMGRCRARRSLCASSRWTHGACCSCRCSRPLAVSCSRSPCFATAGDFFSFVFVVSYVQLVTGLLVALVKEKETKAREMTKVLGVTDGAFVASWMLTYCVLVFV